MKLFPFVCGSSVILAGWLVVTFLHDVPSQRYPKLEKHATRATQNETASTTDDSTGISDAALSPGDLSASISN